MKSGFYCLLLAGGLFSPLHAATPPSPSEAGYVEITEDSGNPFIYELTTDLDYNQETGFIANVPDLELRFSGNGNENLSFSYSGQAVNPAIEIRTNNKADLVFDRLSSLELRNFNTDYPAFFYLQGETSSLKFTDIGIVKITANNGSDMSWGSGLFQIHGSTQSELRFTGIKTDVLINDNTIEESSVFLLATLVGDGPLDSYAATVAFTNIGGKVEINGNTTGLGVFSFMNQVYDGTNELVFRDIAGGLFIQDNVGAVGFISLTGEGDVFGTFEGIRGGVDFSANSSENNAGVWGFHSEWGTSSVTFQNIEGGLNLSNNSAGYNAGALYVYSGSEESRLQFSDIEGGMTISSNTADYRGGALYVHSRGEAYFSVSGVEGDVLFEGNSAGDLGGAVYLEGNEVFLSLTADRGDIIFSGNTHGIDEYANSITMAGTGYWNLSAGEGRSIIFYDPVFMQGMVNPILLAFAAGADDRIEINKGDNGQSYNGRVVFSGSRQDTSHVENLMSPVRGSTYVYDGEFVVEENAIYGGIERHETSGEQVITWYDFSADLISIVGGTLEVSYNGIIAADRFNMQQGSVLRAGHGAFLWAQDIDLTQGLVFDIMPYIENGASGLTIAHAFSLSLGGSLGLSDTLTMYQNARWEQSRSYLILSLNESVADLLDSDFESIYSLAYNSDIVSGTSVYDGTWSMEWLDEEGNRNLYAVWTPEEGGGPVEPPIDPPIDPPGPVDPPIDPPGPEEPGIIPGTPLNSLWTTLANTSTLKNIVLGQVGLRRAGLAKDNNYWATGIGEFSHHKTIGTRDGYTYTGWGYAVGADTMLEESNVLAGIAFGNIYGRNKSKSYNSHINQKSYIGMLYGAWEKDTSQNQTVRLEWEGSYGLTTNVQKTTFENGRGNRGTWDNNIFQLYLEGNYDIAVGEGKIVSPFVGIEFSQAKEKSFTEAGSHARHYDKAQLRYLSLPVGVGYTQTTLFGNNVAWLNTARVSYIPDVYRKNPATTVTSVEAGNDWWVEGAKPSRSAVRFEYGTRVIFDAHWSVFANYLLEGRSHALYQGVNLGVNYSF